MLMLFPDVQARRTSSSPRGKLNGSSKGPINMDLTPAQAVVRRAKQPDVLQLQRQGHTAPLGRTNDHQPPSATASRLGTCIVSCCACLWKTPFVAAAPTAAPAANGHASASYASAEQATLITSSLYASLA